jgi:cystathionine beta-synthase
LPVETFNPGNCKDRMAVKMIADAEADGRLKPGGTSWRNIWKYGIGFIYIRDISWFASDKQSKENGYPSRCWGKVVVCPTDVEPTDPRSYYSVSKRDQWRNTFLVCKSIRQSIECYCTLWVDRTEIWEQTEGKITHFIVGVGTGGISGWKIPKRKESDIKIWGIDTYGSVFKNTMRLEFWWKWDLFL